jgi:ribonuclease R
VESSEGRIGKREIARAFNIRGSDRIPLKRLLRKMADDGVLAKERKRLHKSGSLPPVGVLEVTGPDDDGDLAAVPVNWDRDAQGDPPAVVILPDKAGRGNTKTPGKGDRVLARLTKLKSGNHPPYLYEGRIMRVLTQAGRTVLGVLRVSASGDMRIEPVDRKNRHELIVNSGDNGGAGEGDLVAAEVKRDRGRGLVNGRVTERLGKVGGPKSISMIAVHQHGLPHKFNPKTLAEVERARPVTLGTRTDMRSIPLITIDPPDARDHDDAVWAEADGDPDNKGGFVVIVAIADVAHYVTSHSALDRDARERGNSAYFPDRVVPMLPEKLSADLCSLRPGEERPALAVRMVFDKAGRKKTHAFSRILMRSAAKLSYVQAQAAIDGTTDTTTDPLLEGVLRPLWAAYSALGKARDARAPLDLDLPERKLVFDAKGNVTGVTIPPRLDCHKLIEEFMIQANVCAAETLEKQRSPLLYRVHDAPSDDKVHALSQFLSTLGQRLALGQVLKPRNFNQILKSVKGSDIEQLVNDVVLRTQAQAIYSPENRGHFGLNLRRYAHFTSPIRRYADLIVHRSLISALKLGDGGLDAGDEERLYETAELISAAERRAMAAERDTVDRMIANLMADQLRSHFTGRIAGVTDAGLFVQLPETGANGFIPASTIGEDYFIHDRDAHALVGERSGETYRLGDSVEVRLVEVAPLAGGLRFEMLSDGRKGKPPKTKPRRERHHRRGRR